jgi:hypothetical protein
MSNFISFAIKFDRYIEIIFEKIVRSIQIERYILKLSNFRVYITGKIKISEFERINFKLLLID